MKILFLTIGELSKLEENAMYPDLLRYFRDQGNSVTVICSQERRHKQPTVRRIEQGIEVLRVRTGNITKTNLFEKGISTLLIGLQFIRAINRYFKNVKFDLFLYSTPPITIVNTIKYLKKRNNALAYLMLKDIFPQNALDIGILKTNGWKGIITRYFNTKEKRLYRISDCIGCMSEANAKFLRINHPYLEDKRIEICPNTIDPSADNMLDKGFLRDLIGLPRDKIIFICGGNFGKPQGVDFILAVLKRNEGKADRQFIISGGGTEFDRLQKYAKDENMDHVTIMENLKKDEYSRLLDASNVGLVFLDHRFTIPNFPSRIIDYMNHSLPILAATDQTSDLGAIITENGFGWWCESDDVEAYQRILDQICEEPLVINEMSQISKEFLRNHYITEIAYNKVISAYKSRSMK